MAYIEQALNNNEIMVKQFKSILGLYPEPKTIEGVSILALQRNDIATMTIITTLFPQLLDWRGLIQLTESMEMLNIISPLVNSKLSIKWQREYIEKRRHITDIIIYSSPRAREELDGRSTYYRAIARTLQYNKDTHYREKALCMALSYDNIGILDLYLTHDLLVGALLADISSLSKSSMEYMCKHEYPYHHTKCYTFSDIFASVDSEAPKDHWKKVLSKAVEYHRHDVISNIIRLHKGDIDIGFIQQLLLSVSPGMRSYIMLHLEINKIKVAHSIMPISHGEPLHIPQHTAPDINKRLKEDQHMAFLLCSFISEKWTQWTDIPKYKIKDFRYCIMLHISNLIDYSLLPREIDEDDIIIRDACNYAGIEHMRVMPGKICILEHTIKYTEHLNCETTILKYSDLLDPMLQRLLGMVAI